jgi:ABC-type branched-subunit amino acid transport system permease subunit
MLSIQLLLMIVVGGIGSLHGAVFGAIFVGALPSLIALLRGRTAAGDWRATGPEGLHLRPHPRTHHPVRALGASTAAG